MNVIEFSVPLKLTSPNTSQHWSKKYKTRKTEKLAILSAWPINQTITLPVHIIITRVSPREFDYDNFIASLKGCIDTIAAKLIPGLAPGRADGDPRIKWTFIQEKGPINLKIRIEQHEN